MINQKTVKSALESMLFVWGDPLELATAAAVFGMEETDIERLFEELKQEYEQRKGGILIQRFGTCFQLCTPEDNREFLEKLCSPVKEKKLSRSAMETLAIIAYKQPVTRGEIESIRGVRCGRMVEGLMQKGLVEERGRSEAIGRPSIFGTTDLFLRYFGIEHLDELPTILGEEFMEDEEVESEIQQLSFVEETVRSNENKQTVEG